jgi:hypothetical protein
VLVWSEWLEEIKWMRRKALRWKSSDEFLQRLMDVQKTRENRQMGENVNIVKICDAVPVPRREGVG